MMKLQKQFLKLLLVLCSAIGYAQSFSSPTTIPANGTITVNGVTITATSTGDANNSNTASRQTPCSPKPSSPVLTTELVVGSSSSTPSASTAWSVTLNFSSPVNNVVFSITKVDLAENFIFNSNGGPVSLSHNSCYMDVTGNQAVTNGVIGGSVSDVPGGFFQANSPLPYTQLTINGNGGGFGSIILLSGASVQAVCQAGNSKPIVHDITNTCPSNTVNLNTAHTGTTPAGSSLVWFTNNTHTGTALSGTQVTQATAGTYYAFYYDSVASCYSPVSNAVTVLINTTDSDGDGKPDECDLDDDNDGILDTDEGFCLSTPLLIASKTFSATGSGTAGRPNITFSVPTTGTGKR